MCHLLLFLQTSLTSESGHEMGLNFQENVVSLLNDKPRLELNEYEKKCLNEELQHIRKFQMKLISDSQKCCNKISR